MNKRYSNYSQSLYLISLNNSCSNLIPFQWYKQSSLFKHNDMSEIRVTLFLMTEIIHQSPEAKCRVHNDFQNLTAVFNLRLISFATSSPTTQTSCKTQAPREVILADLN